MSPAHAHQSSGPGSSPSGRDVGADAVARPGSAGGPGDSLGSAACRAPSRSRSEAVESALPGVPAELAGYRATIDNLDAALVHLLAERFRCTQQVGLLKARLALPPSDPGREKRQVARLRALAQDSGLDPVFAEKFFAFIVQEVIRHHEAIRDSQEA